AGACLLVVLLTFVIADSYKDDKKTLDSPPNTAGMSPEQASKAFQDWQEKIEQKSRSAIRGPFRWMAIGEFLSLLIHTASLVMPGLAALAVYSSTAAPRVPKSKV